MRSVDSEIDAQEFLDEVYSPNNKRIEDSSALNISEFVKSGSISEIVSPDDQSRSVVSTTSDTSLDNNVIVSKINDSFTEAVKVYTITKGEWKLADNCYFCRRKFKLNKGRHHCRFCANSVCSSCSNHKLKNMRICDVCQYKHENVAVESTKSNYFEQQKQYEIDLKEKIQTLKGQNKEKGALRHNLYCDLETHNQSQKQELRQYDMNILSLDHNQIEGKSKKNIIVDNLVLEQSILDEKTSIIKELQAKIDSLKVKIDGQNKIQDYGDGKKSDFRQILEDMRNCKETLKYRVDEISLKFAHQLLEKGLKSKDDIGLI